MQARAFFFGSFSVFGQTRRNETLKTLCKGTEDKEKEGKSELDRVKACHWIAPTMDQETKREKKR